VQTGKTNRAIYEGIVFRNSNFFLLIPLTMGWYTRIMVRNYKTARIANTEKKAVGRSLQCLVEEKKKSIRLLLIRERKSSEKIDIR
jgi:hypothetical protein